MTVMRPHIGDEASGSIVLLKSCDGSQRQWVNFDELPGSEQGQRIALPPWRHAEHCPQEQRRLLMVRQPTLQARQRLRLEPALVSRGKLADERHDRDIGKGPRFSAEIR